MLPKRLEYGIFLYADSKRQPDDRQVPPCQRSPMTTGVGKIVFVLLAYNHERYVAQCVRSLADQTFRNFSVIFIDAGSMDRTFEVGKKMLADVGIDSVCIQSRGNGICRNLNLALQVGIEGELFTLLSADDWLYPTSLEERVQFLVEHPDCAMVYAPAMLYWDAEQRYELLSKPYASGRVFEQLLIGNFIPANTVMIRMQVFAEIGVFDEKLAVEDWDMWLRISRLYKIGFIDRPLAYYRKHANNFSRKSSANSRAELETLKKHFDNEVARNHYKRLKVRYSVDYDPLGTAIWTLLKHGRADWPTVKQAVKLGIRRLKK